MAGSGDVVDLRQFRIKVDKHSTGRVADTTTLVPPLVAAAGVRLQMSAAYVPGGTADKLESIPV